jgi:hypothetical protein
VSELISFPATRASIYAFRTAFDARLGIELSSNVLPNSVAGTVIGTLVPAGAIGVPRFTVTTVLPTA